MLNFYHQINLYSLLYLFIVLNIAICSSSNINRAYHYHIDDTQGIVDEIRIDFSYLKNEEISAENSIYLYVDSDQVVSWDARIISSLFKKSNTFIYKKDDGSSIQTNQSTVYPIIENENDKYIAERIYVNVYNNFGGSASDKINQQIIVHTINGNVDNAIIEIPLLESINSEDVLKIKKVPIIFNRQDFFHGSIQMGTYFNSAILNQNSQTVDLEKLNNSINIGVEIIKSDITIDLLKNYKFNDSKLPLIINFELKQNDQQYFTQGRYFKVGLDPGISWIDNFSKINIIADGKKISRDYFDIYLYDSSLFLEVKQSIECSSLVFENLTILSSGLNTSKLYLSANFDPTSLEKKNKRRRRNNILQRHSKEYMQIATSNNDIKIHDIEFWLDSSLNLPFISINNMDEYYTVPNLLIKQNEQQFLNAGMRINLIVPDEIELKWADSIKSEDSKYSINLLDKKNLQLTLKESLSLSDTLKIKDLRFQNKQQSIPLFNLKTQLAGFDNSDEIYCNNKISFGTISADIDRSQIIFTSEDNPSLESLEIFSDNVSSVFQPQDLLWLDLSNSSELSFRLDQKIQSNHNDKIKFSINNQKLNMEILKPIQDKIIIKNILFNNPKKSEEKFDMFLGVQPGSFKSYRQKTTIPLLADFKIYDIDINLLENIEYTKNIDNKINSYILPDILITNNSPFLFDDIDRITLQLSEAIYSYFDTEETQIFSSKNKKKKPSYTIEGNQLIVFINDAFQTMEQIQIKNLGIKLNLDQPSFSSKPMEMNIKINDQNIVVNSTKKVTYGAPILRSRDVQLIFEKQNDIEYAYQMKVDFSEIPKSARRIKDLLIRIPEGVDLSWSTFKKALIESENNLYKAEIEVLNNAKDIVISLDNIPPDERTFLSIGSLAFTNVGLLSDEFNLRMSINQGKNFCSIDNKKQIISESNSVVVMQKIFKEKWYPYKKGNSVDFVIAADAPFIWDVDNFTDIFQKGKLGEYKGDITPKSKMFGDPQFSEDKKKVSFKIISDINDKIKGAESMDFGKKLFLKLKLKKLNNDIGVYRHKPFVNLHIESIFGKQILKGKKDGALNNLTFYKMPKYNSKTNDVVLKIELKNDKNLGDPVQVRWYRNPAYLLTLSKNADEIVEIDGKRKVLLTGFQELERFYKKDFNQVFVNQDWTFWYYLSLYKCKWQSILGEDSIFPIIDELGTSAIGSDIVKAKKFGYNPSLSIYPDPCSDDIPQCKLIFEEILSSVTNEEYNKAYNELYEEIYVKKRIVDCDGYEILSRYLLALLSSCLYDDNAIINNEYSFADFQLKEIKELIKYGDNLINLEKMVESDPLLSELFLFNPIKIDENCNAFNKNKFNNHNMVTFEEIEDNSTSTFIINWHDRLESERNEWEVAFTDKNQLGKNVFLLGKADANYLSFGEETEIGWGKSYQLDFDKQDKEKNGLWVLGITGAATLLFLSF
tara:strand:- start:2816 stop:7156 length:4341 start_codon:yes stop_codon:yes gene_type:complete